ARGFRVCSESSRFELGHARRGYADAEVQFASLEHRYAGVVVGDGAELDSVKMRQALAIVMLITGQHDAVSRFPLDKLERARGHGTFGERIVAHSLYRSLGHDPRVPDLGQCQKWREFAVEGHHHGCGVPSFDLFEWLERSVKG